MAKAASASPRRWKSSSGRGPSRQLFVPGQVLQLRQCPLTPKPYQKPWPEIRIAANSADTFPAIGKLGHAVFVAVRLGTFEELGPNIAAYREAWKEAGHPGEGQVFLRAPVYVAETDAGRDRRARRQHHVFLPLSRRAARGFGDARRRARRRGSRRTRPPAAGRSAMTTRCARRLIVGTPEQRRPTG